MRLSKVQVSIIAILLFHAVGVAGFYLPSFRPLFLRIVPLHILLMTCIIIYNHDSVGSKFLIFTALVAGLGFAGEWLGVHTQILFGHYHYGTTLGPKLWDIPLTIGANWFLLIYGTGVLLQHSAIKNRIVRVLAGAVILVLLDLLIEPVAMHFNYWQWADGVIPFKNYAGWFVVSLVFLSGFEVFGFKKQSRVAAVLIVVQFIFFALLHCVL